MRVRFTNEDALAAWEALSKDERDLYDQIAKYCADLRKKGLKPKRSMVRDHVQRAMDTVCDLMRIIDVLGTPEAPFHGPVEPTNYPDVSEIAAEQKATADRTEQRMQDLLRREIAQATEVTERAAQSVIDGLKAIIREQAEKMADDDRVVDSLCSDLSAAKNTITEIAARLEEVMPGEGDVRAKIDALARAKVEAEGQAAIWEGEARTAQVAGERSTIEKTCAERERNEARQSEIELQRENAMLVARHDLVLENNHKLERQLADRDRQIEEFAQAIVALNKRHDAQIGQMQADHNREVYDLHSKINDLKQALDRVSSLAPAR